MLTNLIEYANKQLSKAGLVISAFGIVEMTKRYSLPEAQGGYSNYWKADNAHYQQLKGK